MAALEISDHSEKSLVEIIHNILLDIESVKVLQIHHSLDECQSHETSCPMDFVGIPFKVIT